MTNRLVCGSLGMTTINSDMTNILVGMSLEREHYVLSCDKQASGWKSSRDHH